MSDLWCEECQNTGFVECFCGGDICICEADGETNCPSCKGINYQEEAFDDE